MKQLEIFPPQDQKLLPRNQYEAIVYFMAHLDADWVSLFLDNEKTYQDFPKYLFIRKLIVAFEQFESDGDKVLTLHKGFCNGCSRGCTGFTFLGKQGKFMDVLFKMKGEEIDDIYECSSFSNDTDVPNKLERVYIDVMEFFS